RATGRAGADADRYVMIYLSSLSPRPERRGALRLPSRCLDAKKGDSVTRGSGVIPEIAFIIKHQRQKCSYEAPHHTAPRDQPWLTETLTESDRRTCISDARFFIAAACRSPVR